MLCGLIAMGVVKSVNQDVYFQPVSTTCMAD
jgi:hypothetical protein